MSILSTTHILALSANPKNNFCSIFSPSGTGSCPGSDYYRTVLSHQHLLIWNILTSLSFDIEILEEYSPSSPFLIQCSSSVVCLKVPYDQIQICILNWNSLQVMLPPHQGTTAADMTAICLSLVMVILITQSSCSPISP